MNFRTFNDLRNILSYHLTYFNEFDVIVGIPRSGYLAASMVGQITNIPVLNLQEFIDEKVPIVGSTRSEGYKDVVYTAEMRVLVVDDSVNSGKSINDVKNKLSSHKCKNIKFLAVYGDYGAEKHVDIILQHLDYPRMFEWNYLHHPLTKTVMFDMDGVICDEPVSSDIKDEQAYILEISNAKPKFNTFFEFGTVVTSRHEKFRSLTEHWLLDNNFKYKGLKMYQGDLSRRKSNMNHSLFKAECYSMSKSRLFVESDNDQAIEISRLSGKQVFCSDNGILYEGGVLTKARSKAKSLLRYVRYLMFR